MNASELYAGEYYALYDPNFTRPRGGSDTPHRTYIIKVKVLRVKKEVQWGNEKRTTYAYVEIAEDKSAYYPKGKELRVKARSIIDFWDEYESRWIDRENQRRQEEEERQKRLQAMREEQERFRKEEEMRNAAIKAVLAKKLEIDETLIHVGSNSVTIPRRQVEKWVTPSAQETY